MPSLWRVSASLLKNGVARYLIANLEFDSPDLPRGDMAMLLLSSHAIYLSQTAQHRSFLEPQTYADLFGIHEHTFVKTTFGSTFPTTSA